VNEEPRTVKIRMSESLGGLLLGEFWRASKLAHERGLPEPPMPPNLEEAMNVHLGVCVLEMPIPDPNLFPPLRGGSVKRQCHGEQ
jgi:hypothetical protein